MANIVDVLNGPNLNLLGTREPQFYGHARLKDVEALCREAAKSHGFDVEFRQSNHEGEIVEWIHEASGKKAAGSVINPAGYTTTSVAILDTIKATRLPTIEIHISNIHAREEFRRHSHISPAAKGVIFGFGVQGYALAIHGLAAIIAQSKE